MKARREPLEPARLVHDASGVPASDTYGDVYHSRAGAIEQARHVFIRGNGLPGRWRNCDVFTVCETGFGLGNNFLALWQAWRECGYRSRRLHVLSFEAHPFTREDLVRALAWHGGELRLLADRLIDAWPPLLPGLHRLEFEGGALTLTLAFGKVEYLARQVEAQVDAFFLDGFSPKTNPAMWSRELFGQLVRIANAGATAATWCSAGQVRRDLSAAGFLVERVPGFGGKRQMTRATLRPELGKPRPAVKREPVAVVGGGLAGAAIARSLALRGHPVAVVDPAMAHGPGGMHEGHRCAAMTPALSRDDNAMSRLSRAGILLAHLRWADLPGVCEPCGSFYRIPPAEADSWRHAVESWRFPPDWSRWCEAAETRELTGISLSAGGVWLGAGALLRPFRLVAALLAHPLISTVPRAARSLRRHDGIWQIVSDGGEVVAEGRRAVIAAAAATPKLLSGARSDLRFPRLEAMQRMGGQVGHFRADLVPATRSIIAGAGYWLPADDGIHVGGSTYVFDGTVSEPSEAGFREVAAKVAGLLELDPAKFIAARAVPEGWAGWRVALGDHLPVIGAVDSDEDLWLACGYGSRGLSWMTLAGEVVASRLNGEPQVLERELLKAVRPR